MRVLITGASGFVGTHLVHALESACGRDAELFLTARASCGAVEALDVTNQDAVRDSIARLQPSHVIHLAGVASPVIAAHDPELAWRVHLCGTRYLAEAILTVAPNCSLINAGTALVYGESARSPLPLDENSLLAPLDDYALTKAAADLALGALSHRKLKCIRMRPFNHIGPGQTEDFVVSAFAMQIARIEMGLTEPVIRVGNLAAERDFLDVRDVAAAYALATVKSDMIASGTILNLASGKAHRISDMLNLLLSLSQVPIQIEQDSARMRPSDLPRLIGSANRARALLGWEPKRPFEQTLADVLADCRERVAVQHARGRNR